jgi:Family of unknown function (DUF5329)
MKRRFALLAFVLPLAAAAAPNAAEQARIDRLIDAIAQLKGAQFIRNGQTHTSADAAKFLREKLKSRGADVTTAEQFVERVASVSSTSGKAYLIRFADGREVSSAEFLRAELARAAAAPR